ncbi:MAG: hypothetical protein LC802_04480 [Acidobacteria bacterium]|nr:hypothetical protein [Acidobacteriota bacterium]
MNTTKVYSIGLAAIMVLAISQQISAQDYSFYNDMFSNMLSNRIWDSIYKQSSPGYSAAKKKSGDSKSRSAKQASTNEVPAYRKYPSVQFKSTGTRLKVKELAELVDPVPEDRPETRRMLSGILEKYEAAAVAKGYPNDLALALVSYIGLNSHVYTGKTGKPIIPFEQNVGLRDMIAENAVQNGTFSSMTDRQRQEMYEVLVMIAGLTYHFYEKAISEKNAEDLKKCKLVAAQNLRMLDIEP